MKRYFRILCLLLFIFNGCNPKQDEDLPIIKSSGIYYANNSVTIQLFDEFGVFASRSRFKKAGKYTRNLADKLNNNTSKIILKNNFSTVKNVSIEFFEQANLKGDFRGYNLRLEAKSSKTYDLTTIYLSGIVVDGRKWSNHLSSWRVVVE